MGCDVDEVAHEHNAVKVVHLKESGFILPGTLNEICVKIDTDKTTFSASLNTN